MIENNNMNVKNVRLLLMDGNELNRCYLLHQMGALNISCDSVANLHEAEKISKSNSYHIIIAHLNAFESKKYYQIKEYRSQFPDILFLVTGLQNQVDRYEDLVPFGVNHFVSQTNVVKFVEELLASA
ncbi:MAG: putative nucleic acid-binding Zn finger protein [Bacteroidia bacterium]|jgi:predicted nucleic acid-binding Zn finger protein